MHIKKLQFLTISEFLLRDCRPHFVRPTSLRIELTQNSLTQHIVLRLLFSCLSAQESTRFARCNVLQSGSIKQACVAISYTLHCFLSRHRIKKAPRFLGELCDPAGTRTQDPYIKSVLLYQLSYRILNRFPFEECKNKH